MVKGDTFSSRIATGLTAVLAITLTSCGSPTAPSRGTASIAITDVAIGNGGSTSAGLGLDVTLTLTASEELLTSSSTINPYVGAGRLPFYLCLSADGVHFTSQCVAGLGIGAGVQARVVGPTEALGIPVTTHLIAFVTPVEEYGVPVTAFYRFGAGNTVPTSALAVDVVPWVIHWEPRPGAASTPAAAP
jgi:hypothetical protein